MKWDSVAIRIKNRRKELGITLAALGLLIGKNRQDGKPVSHVTIRNWESGSEIKKDNFDALAKALDVSQAWLETGLEPVTGKNPKPNDQQAINLDEATPEELANIILVYKASDHIKQQALQKLSTLPTEKLAAIMKLIGE